MKKILALLLTLIVAASLASPASAGKRKKAKGPKPYKSEEVSIEVGHSSLYATTGEVLGVTAQEFINTCAIPNTNGVDAYVWEVPEAYKKVDALVTAIGSGGSAGYDLDILLFDETCEITTASQNTTVDETTVMAKGATTYILVYNFGTSAVPVGGSDPITAHIEIKPYSF